MSTNMNKMQPLLTKQFQPNVVISFTQSCLSLHGKLASCLSESFEDPFFIPIMTLPPVSNESVYLHLQHSMYMFTKMKLTHNIVTEYINILSMCCFQVTLCQKGLANHHTACQLLWESRLTEITWSVRDGFANRGRS